jgi:hypothetical protein
VQDGLKNLQKGAEDTTGTVKEGIEKGAEDAGKAVEDLGNELSGDQSQ